MLWMRIVHVDAPKYGGKRMSGMRMREKRKIFMIALRVPAVSPPSPAYPPLISKDQYPDFPLLSRVQEIQQDSYLKPPDTFLSGICRTPGNRLLVRKR
jgi:hypothetical protein